jgi:hypothetical protein
MIARITFSEINCIREGSEISLIDFQRAMLEFG